MSRVREGHYDGRGFVHGTGCDRIEHVAQGCVEHMGGPKLTSSDQLAAELEHRTIPFAQPSRDSGSEPRTEAGRRLSETDRRVVRQWGDAVRERVRQYGANTTYADELVAVLMDLLDEAEAARVSDDRLREALREARSIIDYLAPPSADPSDPGKRARVGIESENKSHPGAWDGGKKWAETDARINASAATAEALLALPADRAEPVLDE